MVMKGKMEAYRDLGEGLGFLKDLSSTAPDKLLGTIRYRAQ